MQIGGDYPRPIMVNGYACNNCDDVSAAKRGQDPAEAPTENDQAVEFGGSLAAGRGVDPAGGPGRPCRPLRLGPASVRPRSGDKGASGSQRHRPGRSGIGCQRGPLPA